MNLQKEGDVRKKTSETRGWAVIGLVGALTACGASAHEGPQVWSVPGHREQWTPSGVLAKDVTPPNGLVIERDASVSGHLRGHYTDASGQVVTFETRRGRRYWERRRKFPFRRLRHEIDVCVRDTSGTPLLIQLGGDEALIPGCDPESEGLAPQIEVGGLLTPNPGAPQARPQAAQCALEALKAVKKARFQHQWREEQRALTGQAHLALDLLHPQVHPETRTPQADDEGGTRQLIPLLDKPTPLNVGFGYQHYIEIHAGDAFDIPCDGYFGGCPNHSATVAYLWQGSKAIALAWSRCNHGRCYYEIPWKCSLWTTDGRGLHIHDTPCHTYYNAFSNLGGHNCNDDSTAEYWSVRADQHYPGGGYTGVCDDGLRNDFAPGCF